MKNTNKIIQLTAGGLAELQAELKDLNEVKMPAVIKRVADARAHGDLSENAEYSNAKEEQQLVEARIEEIEYIISKAVIVKPTKSTTKVGIGTNVVVTMSGKKGKTLTYHIAGEFEGNPKEGQISADSPLGKALIGKKKGDQVKVNIPAGEVTYTIEEIK